MQDRKERVWGGGNLVSIEKIFKWKFPTTSIVNEEIEHFVEKISLGNNFRFSSKSFPAQLFQASLVVSQRGCLEADGTHGKEHNCAGLESVLERGSLAECRAGGD